MTACIATGKRRTTKLSDSAERKEMMDTYATYMLGEGRESEPAKPSSLERAGSVALDLKLKPSKKKYCPNCGWAMETDYDTAPDGSMIAEWCCIDCGHHEPKPLNEKLSDDAPQS